MKSLFISSDSYYSLFVNQIYESLPDLEVVEPQTLRDELKAKAEQLAWRYGLRTDI